MKFNLHIDGDECIGLSLEKAKSRYDQWILNEEGEAPIEMVINRTSIMITYDQLCKYHESFTFNGPTDKVKGLSYARMDAFEMMKKGNCMTHRNFTSDEYLLVVVPDKGHDQGQQVMTEDGYNLDDRFYNDPMFVDGWTIKYLNRDEVNELN